MVMMLIIYFILSIIIIIQFLKLDCKYNKSKWATIILLFICIVLLYTSTHKIDFSSSDVINLGKFGKFQ